MSFMDFFLQCLKGYPSLYLYLLEDVDTPCDYFPEGLAHWAKSLYKVLQEKFVVICEDLQGPLKPLIQSVDLRNRGVELERTMLNLMCLEAVLQDDYAFFETSPVPFDNVLSKEQFYYLQDLIKNYYPEDKIKLLQNEISINDFGKVRSLRYLLAKEFHIESSDPDQVMSDLFAMKHEVLSEIFPGLKQLSKSEFQEFVKIKTGFHFGHFAHAESTPKQLSLIKEFIQRQQIDLLYQNFIAHLFDLSGAMAHVDGAILLNDSIFQVYSDCVLPSLNLLYHVSEEEAYEHYLKTRAKQVGFSYQTNQLLSWSETFSLRILCLLRIYHNREAQLVFSALDKLWGRAVFADQCEKIHAYQMKQLKVPTYMPTLFSILLRHFKSNSNPYEKCIAEGIRLIACGLELHDTLLQSAQVAATDPVNFNSLAKCVKDSPDWLTCISSKSDLVIRRSDKHILPASLDEVVRYPRGYLRV